MSKTWYPVIDYDKCTGCLACYEKCTHGVYELNSRDFPKVVFPEGCVHGCKGCGSLCPQEAITYMGDSDAQAKSDCCAGSTDSCSCGCGGEEETEGCGEDAGEKTGGCGCGCC